MVHESDEMLWRYALGSSTDEAERLEVQAHLGACEDCVRRLRAMRHMRENLDSVWAEWPLPAPGASAVPSQAFPRLARDSTTDPAPQSVPRTGASPEEPDQRLDRLGRLWNTLRVAWRQPAWRRGLAGLGLAGALVTVTVVVVTGVRPFQAGHVALLDSTGPVPFEREGDVQLPGAAGRLPGEWQARFRIAIKDGTIQAPEPIRRTWSQLQADSPRLGSEGAPELLAREPVGCLVRSTTPQLHWSSPIHARALRVLIAEGPRIVWEAAASADTPSRIQVPEGFLQAGHAYVWQVEASVDGNLKLSPPARFAVLAPELSRELAALEATAGPSALVRFLLYATYGLEAEAQVELERLRALNAGNQLIDRLAAGLRHAPGQ